MTKPWYEQASKFDIVFGLALTLFLMGVVMWCLNGCRVLEIGVDKCESRNIKNN